MKKPLSESPPKLAPDGGLPTTTCSLPVEGMKITPYGWGDPLLSGAFMACVKWAATEDEVTAAFEKETGLSLKRLVGRAPITIMVDDATGFARDLVAKWFDWVAANVWGEDGSDDEECERCMAAPCLCAAVPAIREALEENAQENPTT